MTESTSNLDLLRLTAGIVSAHARRHPIILSELPDVIRSVYAALRDPLNDRLSVAATQSENGTDDRTRLRLLPAPTSPAVPINRSVFPEYIICLEDGTKRRMLKRYLRTNFGLTPDEYRARWGLPADYPMEAPKQSAIRSGIAKGHGFGRKSGDVSAASQEVVVQQIPAGMSGKRAYRKRRSGEILPIFGNDETALSL
jgi:predicted transcriptional regulator